MTQLPLDFTSPRPDVRFRYRLELAEETCVPYDEDVCLTRPGEIARFLTRRVFCREPREILAVLFLDVRLALIGHQIAYTGSLHRVIADPRQIFRTTDRLEKGGEILGIRLHDHMIVAPDGRWRSLRAAACWAST